MTLVGKSPSGAHIGLLQILPNAIRGLVQSPKDLFTVLVDLPFSVLIAFMKILFRGFKTKYPSWTIGFELYRAFSRRLAAAFGNRIASQGWYFRAGFPSSEVDRIVQKNGQSSETVVANGLEHIWIRSGTQTDERVLLLMYHGGGYCILCPTFLAPFASSTIKQLENELAKTLGKTVAVDAFLANYRKAPEYPFPVPAEDAVAIYDYLLKTTSISPKRIVMFGDSAGGGLVMSVLLRLRDRGDSNLHPAAAYLHCPYVDLSEDGQGDKIFPDCILSENIMYGFSRAYMPTWADRTTWKDASAVHCNLSDLPPVFVQCGGLDYIQAGGMKLAQKAKEDGCKDWELEVIGEKTHDFAIMENTDESTPHNATEPAMQFAVKHLSSAITK